MHQAGHHLSALSAASFCHYGMCVLVSTGAEFAEKACLGGCRHVCGVACLLRRAGGVRPYVPLVGRRHGSSKDLSVQQPKKPKLMNPCKFVICTPPYANHSAGIIVLHELCDALIRQGHEAYVAFIHMTAGRCTFHYPLSDEGFNPGLKRMSLDKVEYERAVNDALDNGICIYPDIVQGNPLLAKRVVRYFLYYDGGITGIKSSCGEGDYILSFSPQYFKGANRILFKPVVDANMHDEGAPMFESRSLDLTFFGKGPNYAQCHLVDGSIELPKAWPKSKVELAALLRCTRYVYTWDYHSSLNLDAVLCGARPVLMQAKQLELDGHRLAADGFGVFLSPFSRDVQGNLIEPADYASRRSWYVDSIRVEIENWMNSVEEFCSDVSSYFYGNSYPALGDCRAND